METLQAILVYTKSLCQVTTWHYLFLIKRLKICLFKINVLSLQLNLSF